MIKRENIVFLSSIDLKTIDLSLNIHSKREFEDCFHFSERHQFNPKNLLLIYHPSDQIEPERESIWKTINNLPFSRQILIQDPVEITYLLDVLFRFQ